MLPILYSFRRCPYAMRARFSLVYREIKCELREVDLKNKPQELLNISPKATVPVLLLPDGSVIDESMDIIHYAIGRNDQDVRYAQNSKSTNLLINKNDTEFAPILRKYKYCERYDKSQETYRKQAEAVFIISLEEKLQQNKYITGDKLSIADIAIFPFIRQFAMVDQDWFDSSSYLHIRQWLQIITNTPLYDVIMQKHSPWKSGDEIVLLKF